MKTTIGLNIIKAMANRKYVPTPFYKLTLPKTETTVIMNNKYYTPNKEDLRIGYECEISIPQDIHFLNYDWEKVVIKEEFFNHEKPYFPFTSKIRVPYLTKEQIESEGWEFGESQYGLRFYAKKNNIILGTRALFYEARWLEVFREGIPLTHLFSGQCKSINEFRYICKLLNI